MKKYLFLIVLTMIMCVFCFGCQKNTENENYTLKQIEESVKEADYELYDKEYDGLYDEGNGALGIWMPIEDGINELFWIMSYDDEKQVKGICDEIEKQGFHDYMRKGNIVAVYGKGRYSNIEETVEKILNCEPPEYKSIVLKYTPEYK